MFRVLKIHGKEVVYLLETSFLVQFLRKFQDEQHHEDDAKVAMNHTYDIGVIVPYAWGSFTTGQNDHFKKILKTFPPCRKLIVDHSNEGGPNLRRFDHLAEQARAHFGPEVEIVYVSQARHLVHHPIVQQQYFQGFVWPLQQFFEQNPKKPQEERKSRVLMLGGCPRPEKQIIFITMFDRKHLDTPSLLRWSFGNLKHQDHPILQRWLALDFVLKYAFGPRTKQIVTDHLEAFRELTPHILDVVSGNKAKTCVYPRELYASAHMSFVVESEFTAGHMVRYTEKTLRAIASGHPFLVLGNPRTLDGLKKDGFRTFEGILNESYDEIKDREERFFVLMDEMERILAMSDQEFEDKILTPSRAVCEFNFQHLLSMVTREDLKRFVE